MDNFKFIIYLAVMAGVTYLVRMLPFVLVKKRIENKFILSFLYYVPYAVLSSMTIPAILYSTANKISAAAGFAAAVVCAYFEKSLVRVAAAACAAALICEAVMKFI